MRHREERFIATAPNQAWSIDFVADQLHDGTRFRALTILDVYTWEGVAIEGRAGEPDAGDHHYQRMEPACNCIPLRAG